MSVPKSKRGVSKIEFLNKAYDIHKKISTLLLRDFGIKSISRELKTFTHNAKMTHDDREAFTALCNKYRIDVESSYPLWLILYYREWILDTLRAMINHITIANTIYPSEPHLKRKLELRLEHQELTIGNCHQVLQALQLAGEVLPVDYEKFMPYVEMLHDEITLLKGWRKAGNKLAKANAQKESV